MSETRFLRGDEVDVPHSLSTRDDGLLTAWVMMHHPGQSVLTTAGIYPEGDVTLRRRADSELRGPYVHPDFPDPGHNRPVLKDGLYCTWNDDHVNGGRYPSYVRAPFLGMSGATNQDPNREGVPLGQLHANCRECSQRGYCATMCPTDPDAPGWVCTVDMDSAEQELTWMP